MGRDLLRSTPLRIATIIAVAFFIALLVAGSTAVVLIRQELATRLDRSIQDDFAVISQSYGDSDVADLADLASSVDSHAGAATDHDRVYLLRGVGTSVLAGNIEYANAPIGWSTVPASALGLGSANRYRVFSSAVNGNALLVGASFRESEAIAGLALQSFAWACGIVVVLVGTTVGLIALRGQRRLDAIASTMAEIGRGELGARLRVSRRGDDIDVVAASVNAALDRLAAVVEGMRQVSVDIAHDLKSPLNRLMITIETALDSADPGNATARQLRQAQEEARQINATFEALLRIAQIEAGARRQRFAAVRLDCILDNLVEIYAGVAEESGMRLSASLPSHLPEIEGDRELLTQLFANLIENSIRHCQEGAVIEVATTTTDKGVNVIVSDSGPGIPLAERAKVFRRLYRVEQSRTTPGTGLGLSLVKAVADLHFATVELGDNHPGLRVTVAFGAPASPPNN